MCRGDRQRNPKAAISNPAGNRPKKGGPPLIGKNRIVTDEERIVKEEKKSDFQPYFFGYPTDWERVIFCSGLSFISFASASRSMFARMTVASPSDAQKR